MFLTSSSSLSLPPLKRSLNSLIPLIPGAPVIILVPLDAKSK
jgi:hypothetical protein